jgi:hypothetical protein
VERGKSDIIEDMNKPKHILAVLFEDNGSFLPELSRVLKPVPEERLPVISF